MLGFIGSCEKEPQLEIPVEIVFADSDSLLSQYQHIIINATSGWEYTWDASDKGFYAGFIKFIDQNSGEFLFDQFSGIDLLSYTFKVEDKKPTLALTIETVSDELNNVFKELDLSFTVLRQIGDTLLLKGNQFGHVVKMVPIDEVQEQAYKNGGVKKQVETIEALQHLPFYFKRLFYNGGYYDIHFNTAWRKVYIHYGLVDRFKIYESSYAYTPEGIRLQHVFSEDANSFSSIELGLDIDNQLLTAKVDGKNVLFTNESSPSALDPQAVFEFYNTPFRTINITLGESAVYPQSLSISQTGFTVAGQVDAYGLAHIPSYGYLCFFNQWLDNSYGAFRWLFTDFSLSSFGPAFTPEVVGNRGTLRFRQVGHFGEVPESLKAFVDPTLSALLDTQGFYVIKSGPASYDLVSFEQAPQKWIRFE